MKQTDFIDLPCFKSRLFLLVIYLIGRFRKESQVPGDKIFIIEIRADCSVL
jgi:hypothetical protein